jgi:O-antigen ligase
MVEQTEQDSLVGWRKQFGTLYHFCRGISAETLENVTVALIMLLILMLPVEMLARLFSGSGIYNAAYSILGGCIEATAFLWLGKRILVSESFAGSRWTLCDGALLAMLGWSVLSTLAAPDPRACFQGDLYRNEGLVTYFIYACVYLLIRNCCGRESVRRMLSCLVFSVSLLSVFSTLCMPPLADLLGMPASDILHIGSCGPFDNRNHFCYILGIATVIAGGLYITDRCHKMKPVYLFLYVLLVHAMIRNQSLGGYLAAGIGIGAYLVVACIRKDLKPRKAAVLAVLFVVVSCISSCFGEHATADAAGMAGSVMDQEVTTTQVRLYMWKKTLNYIAQRPLLGYGPDGSGVIIFEMYNEVNNRPHNEYLQYAAYLGIPGLAMYLTALGSLLVRLLRSFRNLSPVCVVMACAVLAYCASAFVGNTMYYTTIYYVGILAMLVNESEQAEPVKLENTAR